MTAVTPIPASTTGKYAKVYAQLIDPNDVPIGNDNQLNVLLSDQTTRPLDFRMHQVVDDTISLASSPTPGSYDVTLNTGHSVTTGEFIVIVEENDMPNIFWGEVLSVSGDTITLDTPIPYAFTTNAQIYSYVVNMNVDGSVTTQTFGITNFFDTSVDITRIIFHITDEDSMDDGKFGGIPELTRGVVFRKKISDTEFINYFNIKTNGDIGELAYDKKYDAKAPAGVYGLTSRLTFASQGKHGVAIRIKPGESIQCLIQDDLTGLTSFNIMVEGHITTE